MKPCLEILWRSVICYNPRSWRHVGELWLTEEDKLIVVIPLLLLWHLAPFIFIIIIIIINIIVIIIPGQASCQAGGRMSHWRSSPPFCGKNRSVSALSSFMTLLFTIGIVNISLDTESLYIISLCIYLNPAAQSWSKACSSIVCLRKYRDVYLERETSIKSNIVKLNWYQKIEFTFMAGRVMKTDITYAMSEI